MAKSQEVDKDLQQNGGWQSTKNTVLERNSHMFNNKLMSDVKLTCKGSETTFFAHKYVLVSSSKVFDTMFKSKVPQEDPIHVKDTSKEYLEEFLRFLYTEECNLTAGNVTSVLNLAKKYFVRSLEQKCVKFLEHHLDPENAFTILQQAIQFDEKRLEKKCWDFIDRKTTEIFNSDAFVDIDLATLEKLLKRESLKTREVELFKAVLKWSEAECLRKGIEANANNKRAAIGNAINQIRFASMTLQEFGQNVSQSGILTPEENVLFYDKFSGLERASKDWNLSERGAGERTLIKCCRFLIYLPISLVGPDRITSEHTTCVSFSKPVNFHGVRLLSNEEEEYDVKLDVFSQLVEKKFRSQRDNRGLSGFDVMFPVPIQVHANTVVQLKATITGTHCRKYGTKGKKKVEANGITVNFYNVPGLHSCDTVEQGQFDEIIFSEI